MPTEQRAFRLEELWGKERTSGLIGAEGEEIKIRVQGFISPPQVHLNTGRYVALIVNRRWVRSPVLYPLILRSYQGLLPQGRFPLAALWMEVPPELVDVNIHPAKQEVSLQPRGMGVGGGTKGLGPSLKKPDPAGGQIPDGLSSAFSGSLIGRTAVSSGTAGGLDLTGGFPLIPARAGILGKRSIGLPRRRRTFSGRRSVGKPVPFRDCFSWGKYTDRTFWPWENRVCWWVISMPPTSGSCMKNFFRDSTGTGGPLSFC